MSSEQVAIVIPALNEEEAIRHLLPEIPPDTATWIIVADNGSTDNTAEVAHSLGALVSSEPIRGYGRNCLAGFKMACTLGADIVVFLDGDGSDDPADLPMMLAPLSEGRADLVVGSRVSDRSERGAVSPQARATASITPVTIPGSAVGSTIRRIVFHLGVPSAYEPSRSAVGTSRSISSVERVTVGSISTNSASAAAKPE